MEGDIGSIFAAIAQFAHHAGRHSTSGEDPVTPASIGAMPEPPADGKKYLATKNGTAAAQWDTLDGSFVEYDADGNLTFQAGMDMRTSIPQSNDPDTGDPVDPVVRTVLDTDNNGNFIVGNPEGELNLQASVRPTTQIGDEATPRRNAFLEDIEDVYATEAYVDAADALKADLVGGKIPVSQMPPGAIPNNFTVTDEADLITLTTAIPNDRAKVTATDEIWLLWTLPATDFNSWENITSLGSGTGGDGGVLSVNGMTGAVSIDLPNLSAVQNALGDKANSADLASYAPIASPALTGTPTAPTPAASAIGG